MGNGGTQKPVGEKLEILSSLDRWIHWYRLRRAARWAVRGFAFGFGTGMLAALAAVSRALLLQDEAVLLVLAVSGFALILAGGTAYAWPFPRLKAARFFDLRFGLHERISTALELSGEAGQDTEPSELHAKQIADAQAAARKVDVRKQLPVRFAWQEIVLLLVLGLAAFLSYRWSQPHFEAAQEKRLVQQSIAKEKAEVESILEEIEKSAELAPAQKEALTAPLEEARQQLQEADSLEQSVSILTRAEGELSSLSNADAPAQMQALKEAGQRLTEAQESPLQEFGEQLAGGEVQAAAESLDRVDLSQLEPQKREAIAQRLDQAAADVASSDPELAGQLQTAAAELRSGNVQAAQQALQEARGRLSEFAGQAEGQIQAGQAAAQVEAARQRLLQQASGASPQGSAGQGQTPGSGQAGLPGEQGPASGQTSGSGLDNTANSGGGAGRGEGAEGTGAGQQAGSGPIAQENGPGDGGEQPYEPIAPPQRLGGSGGDVVTLPEIGSTGEAVTGEGNLPFERSGQSRVPYEEVYPEYAETYRQAIESGQVPLLLRSLVRDYFSSLEP